MDKVKVFLGYAQKYHFWILCLLVVVASLVGWTMARGTLSDEFAKHKGSVTGAFDKLKGIQQNQYPPNTDWTTKLAALTKQEQTEVANTWKEVYGVQQEVLKWPDVMPEGFKTWIPTAAPDAEIPAVWRTAYQTEVIKHEFPQLAKIVGAAPMEADGGANDRSSATSSPMNTRDEKPAAAGEPSPSYKVRWENQAQIKSTLEMPGGAPTSFKIRLVQEDYWVLQALLNIIRKTNDGAQWTPRVKVIEELAIGSHTASAFEKGMASGHITRLSTGEEGGEDYGAPPPMAEAPLEGEEPAPDQGRYVDAEGKIMEAGTAQQQQFKRLPVYMKLVMDQREITRLLTECANYPLPVEVRQLRINPGASGTGSSAAAGGRGGPQRGGGGSAAGPGSDKPIPGEAYDVTVEIHGIIYLFNPPDPAKLGADSTGQTAG